MSNNNPQSRKWLLTINNPQDSGLDHSEITRILMLMNITYFCMVDEIATTGTPHTHIFIFRNSPLRFNTLKNRFPVAHIDKSLGSCQDNRNYLRKEGKWADTEKAETNILNTFIEYGEMPTEKYEVNPEYAEIIENIESGMTIAEIIRDKPKFALRVKGLEELSETIKAEEYLNKLRQVKVIYIFSSVAEIDKTSYIYSKHNYSDICRITNYDKNGNVRFDSYNGQDIVAFENFVSQINIESMLNYLDIYPLNLPARYRDRVACYTTVYITSNLPLNRQYITIQEDNPNAWYAFLKRIYKLIEFRTDGEVKETILNDLPTIQEE